MEVIVAAQLLEKETQILVKARADVEEAKQVLARRQHKVNEQCKVVSRAKLSYETLSKKHVEHQVERESKRQKKTRDCMQKVYDMVSRHREQVRGIFLEQDKIRRTGAQVMECEFTGSHITKIPDSIKLHFPQGIQGTEQRKNGKQAFRVFYKNVSFSSSWLDLPRGAQVYEDPRDCAAIIYKLDALMEETHGPCWERLN